eukprot:2967236-Rhodomonas_salina.2
MRRQTGELTCDQREKLAPWQSILRGGREGEKRGNVSKKSMKDSMQARTMGLVSLRRVVRLCLLSLIV